MTKTVEVIYNGVKAVQSDLNLQIFFYDEKTDVFIGQIKSQKVCTKEDLKEVIKLFIEMRKRR